MRDFPDCRRRAITSVLTTLIVLTLTACSPVEDDGTGRWHAWLDSPGGELPFGLVITPSADGIEAVVINGEERIRVDNARIDGENLVIAFPHYDSTIRAVIDRGAGRLDGEWTKRSRDGWSRLPFHATRGERDRFEIETPRQAEAPAVEGRFAVDFSSDEHGAVGLFETDPEGKVAGTFLTATGDYRYLAGVVDGRRLRLSCFDGAHAFLFDAELQTDGSLAGDFWSRDTWHETWTARPDPEADLPDGFELTTWTDVVSLGDLSFPDLDGVARSLADPELAGRVRIIEILGSWCPNCNDASELTVELYRRYREQGLSVVALAFEITGEFDRDVEQVRRYVERHDIDYPVLLAGTADKTEASATLPVLDRLRAYPTFVFLDATGQVRAVYTGFSGPATGEAHLRLRESFTKLIERLLAE
jgi:thiol-disulfide isomerase/thioredoxin